jgi:SnoaL-like domain
MASLFAPDGALRMPHGNIELAGREQIRAFGGRRQDLVDYLVQTTHPGTIHIDGDTASGRAYMSELIRLRDGSSHLNYAIYHTATGAPATAGSSPNASTRSGTSTAHRWRARRPAHRASAPGRRGNDEGHPQPRTNWHRHAAAVAGKFITSGRSGHDRAVGAARKRLGGRARVIRRGGACGPRNAARTAGAA